MEGQTKTRCRTRGRKRAAGNLLDAASLAQRIARANELGELLTNKFVISDSADREALFKVCREAREIFEELVAADPANSKWQQNLSVTHDRIGEMLTDAGDLTAAMAEYRKSFAICERLAEADPGNADWLHGLAVSYDRIGDMLIDAADADASRRPAWEGWRATDDYARFDALADYRKALAIRERLAAVDPGNVEWQRGLAVSYDRIGEILGESDPDAGLDEYRKALAICEKLAAADPGNKEWQRDLAGSYERIAEMLAWIGPWDAPAPSSLAEYRKALAIRERLAAADPGASRGCGAGGWSCVARR
jgi:tetratricopeptide (TPR) repeat protein